MANEYILSYTAEEINNKLGKIDTFGDYFDVAGDGILTWDGDESGKLSFDISYAAELPEGAIIGFKVSDYIPTLAQLEMGASVIVRTEDSTNNEVEEEKATIERFYDMYSDGSVYVSVIEGDSASSVPFVIIVTKELPMPDGTMCEPGIYFVKADGGKILGVEGVVITLKVASVTFNGITEFNKRDVLKAEHMEILQRVGSDTLVWDGRIGDRYNFMGALCHVSDIVPTVEDLQNGGSAIITYQGETKKFHFNSNYIIDMEAYEMGEGCIMVAYIFLPMAIIATKPNAHFTWQVSGEPLEVALEKPGVYFPCITGEMVTTSFMIHGYDGFIKDEIKVEHMPHVNGTIVAESFGTPYTAWNWLNENYDSKKIVRIKVTNSSGQTDYGTYEKVTKETGDGSDGYTYYTQANPETPYTGLSTTYYAFHSTKSGNVNANGTSIKFLHGGLYQTYFFPREGNINIGTEGVSWEYDVNATFNRVSINNASAEDSGFEIAFYCIE